MFDLLRNTFAIYLMTMLQRTWVIFGGLAAAAAMTAIYFHKKRRKIAIKPIMQLYVFDKFRSRRCEWLLAELGVQNEVECITMNPRDPDQEKLAQYRKIHPHGTIPCLVVEGRQAIIESGAICLYLADVYGKLGPDADKEAFYSWLVYSTATLDEVMETLLVQWVFTDLPDQDADLINKCVLKFNSAAKYLSQCLNGRDYICGNKFTAADCVLGYNIWWALEMKDGLLLKDFPLILDYYKRLQMRSAFQRVFSELF